MSVDSWKNTHKTFIELTPDQFWTLFNERFVHKVKKVILRYCKNGKLVEN